jgi:hypothetical protein
MKKLATLIAQAGELRVAARAIRVASFFMAVSFQ